MKSGTGCVSRRKNLFWSFWSWLGQQKPVRNTRIDKAVNYVLNRRDTAEACLEDGRCSFTNNSAKMQSVHSQQGGRTGCSAVPQKERMPVQQSAQWLRWQKHMAWIFTNISNICRSIGQVKIWPMNSRRNWRRGVKNFNLSKIACEL